MRKNLLIVSGIIILALVASFILQPSQKILHDDNGKPYFSLTKKHAVLNYKEKDMFIVKDEAIDTLISYQITGFPSDKVSYRRTFEKIPEVRNQAFENVAEVMFFYLHEETKLQDTKVDTLDDQYFKGRKALFKNADHFEGRRYIIDESKNTSWFTRIDDSILVFNFMSFIPFLILLFNDAVLYLLKAKPFKIRYHSWQILLLLLTVLFFFNMVTPQSYAADNMTAFLKYNLLFFSIYLIYQYLIKGILKEEQAYKKAIILFALCIVCSLGSTIIARLIDEYVFHSDGFTDLAERPIYFELGFLFSFTLGNFFNNLRKNYFKHRRRSKALESTEEKALASEAELNSIQSSVNPHFLYNSLNAIASLAKSDPDKTEAMALALSKFYKYQTNREGKPLTTLSEELQMIENYLAIEKIRFGDRLQYQLSIDEQSKNKKIPHFLLQPLLENAIKYGYDNESEKINISLYIKTEKGQLNISLFDQGKPFTENLDSGYGLKSVMKKLQLFYPNNHTIDFINAPKKHVAIRLKNS